MGDSIKKILCCVFLIFIYFVPVKAFDYYSAYHQPGLLTINVEDIEKPYTVKLSYEGVNYYTVIDECYEDKFEIYRLANGVTYYVQIIDALGEEMIKRYTTPYTVVNADQLRVIDIKDNACTVEWSYLNSYYDIDLYLNGVNIKTLSPNKTSFTLTDLNPNTEYRVHITTKTGYISNIVTFRTTDFENSFFARLNDMIAKFFVPNNTYDGNFNGVPDTYDGILRAWKQWEDYSPISSGKGAANVIKDLTGDFEGSDEYPNFQVTFGPGLTFNVFDFEEFDEQIQVIRKLLSAVIWITFFMFLVQLLIPIFKI